RSVQSADRFLQNEVRSHAESFLRGRPLAVQDGEGYRALVAGRVSQTLQQSETAGEIVAIYNNRVELVGNEHIGAGARFMADLHVNGQLLQCGPDYPNKFRVLAQKQRVQGHRGDSMRAQRVPIVTKVSGPKSQILIVLT